MVSDGAMQRHELAEHIEQLHPASYGWALSCCGRDRDQAEEILQDVYVKILEGKARFDGRSSLKTWLFAVIRRTALSQGRRRAARDFLLAKWLRLEPDAEAANPHLDAEHSQVAAILLEALRRLARRQREVLELVFYHGMTIEEAAAALDVSVGSARVHYQRGKQQLLARLEGRVGVGR